MPGGSAPSVRALTDGIAYPFHSLTSPTQVLMSSADSLVPRGRFRRLLRFLRDLRHVEHIAVEVGSGRPSAEVVPARATGQLARKLTPLGTVNLGVRRFDVHAVHTVQTERPRRYLSEVSGVARLTRRLNDKGVKYAALRWFDALPHPHPGKDLDLLVADRDLATKRSILAEEPGTIAVDLYSETGLPGADYQGAGYYVPDLAREILAGAVVHESGCRVPSPADHLHSLGCHGGHHKEEKSGLASDGAAAGFRDLDHDYGGTLQTLAAAVGAEIPVSLDGFGDFVGDVPHGTLSYDWRRRRTGLSPEALVPDVASRQNLERLIFRARYRTVGSGSGVRRFARGRLAGRYWHLARGRALSTTPTSTETAERPRAGPPRAKRARR